MGCWPVEKKFSRGEWLSTNHENEAVPGVRSGDDRRRDLNNGFAGSEVEPLSEDGRARHAAGERLRTIGRARDNIAAR